MAGKRQATYELNHDNYDDELPEEEAGEWKPADASVLKDRPKLKARRSLINNSGGSDKPSLFGSFSFNLSGSGGGGVNSSTASASASPFSGLSFLTPKANDKTNGSSKTESPVTPVPSQGNVSVPGKANDSAPSSSTKTDHSKYENSSTKRLSEIAAEKLRLLKEKERIERDLKKLELEESQLKGVDSQSNSNVSSVTSSSNEDPELPPEEPWN